MVALLVKACRRSLKAYPEVNSSLDGEELILKRFYNIGFAADTPQGLRRAGDQERRPEGPPRDRGRADASSPAPPATGKLKLPDMQGATFTISSLGGIGGTSFTPIVNAPRGRDPRRHPLGDEAGLGRRASSVPRLMVPLSLSYDHRVVDGALAARFVAHLAGVLADMKRVLL